MCLQILLDSADFRFGVFGIEISQRLKEVLMIIPVMPTVRLPRLT